MKFSFEPDDLDILQGIVEESSEHLNGIEEGIVRLENDFNTELMDSIFRALHSVKGVSSFVDFVPIKDTAHALESLLMDMKKGIYATNSEITDVLLRGVDILNLTVGQLHVCVQDLESNPPREAFEIVVDDCGFQEFVIEVEELRSAQADAVEQSPQSDTEIAKPEAASGGLPGQVSGTMKMEMSSFLEQMQGDFIEETAEHLDNIEQKCVELEKYPGDPEILNSILRGFHSIKGGAGVISSMQDQDNPHDPVLLIKALTHAAETLLQAHRNQSCQLSTEVIDLILAAVDKVSVLNRMVRDKESNQDFSIDNLMEKIEKFSVSGEDVTSGLEPDREVTQKLPQQLAAFKNITGQALDSMQSLIKSAREGQPVNKKRIKQYVRALKSIISTASYLDYQDLIELVEKTLVRLENYVPERDLVSQELLQMVEADCLQIKELSESKILNVQDMIDKVPENYSEKKLGEILIEEKKVTPQQIEWALQQQKKLGNILVTSGTVKSTDIDMALAKQSLAREKKQQTVEEARTSPEVTGQSIRVSQEKLDRLMNMIGELLISKNRVFHLADKISLDYDIPVLAREVKNIAGELGRISDELQDSIMSARMIPLRVLFQRYPRTIRDIARKAGKTVELIIDGEDTELDKTVIEAINDPLVHMLRNAVDHAIEPPEVRTAIGKEAAGHINLKAFYQGNDVIIEITDDGKGLNPEEIKLKALKKGLIGHEQIENMSNQDAYQLIFAPGFSTKDEVSELSGRGVGMDVVRNNIEGVGGSVNMTSTINVGTNFSLRIPLSMSIIKGLMVETGGQHFIIPLDSIEETVKMPGDRIRFYKQSMVADIRGEILPLIDLKEMLNIYEHCDAKKSRQFTADDLIPVVVINIGGTKLGVIIDSFQKEQEFLVKALIDELAALKIYTGASIMGDGSVVLILNPNQLLNACIAGDHGRAADGINYCCG
ncbi:MAG: chemotaxis protein CheA [Syntrophomonas sp.]